MKLWKANGLYHAEVGGNKKTAQTLEKLLGQLAPYAPDAYLYHTAEILEPLIGTGHEQVKQGVAS